MIKLFRIVSSRHIPFYVAPGSVCAVYQASDEDDRDECFVVTQGMTFPRVVGTAEEVANRIDEALSPRLMVDREPMPPLPTLPDKAFTALPIRRPGEEL